MDSTFKRKVKGKHMEKLFDMLDIRYFNAVDNVSEDDYDENNTYEYVIRLRHPDGYNGEEAFDNVHNGLLK